MRTIKKNGLHLKSNDICVGNVIPVGNSVRFYRIISATEQEFEVKEITNPYELGYFYLKMKAKLGWRRFMIRLALAA